MFSAVASVLVSGCLVLILRRRRNKKSENKDDREDREEPVKEYKVRNEITTRRANMLRKWVLFTNSILLILISLNPDVAHGHTVEFREIWIVKVWKGLHNMEDKSLWKIIKFLYSIFLLRISSRYNTVITRKLWNRKTTF